MIERVVVPPGIARLEAVFCGCGCSYAAWEAVHDELDRQQARRPTQWPDETNEWWVVVFLLDHLKLTEHGSTIDAGWLTDDGKAALAFLEKWGEEWEDREDAEFFSVDPEGDEVWVGGAR